MISNRSASGDAGDKDSKLIGIGISEARHDGTVLVGNNPNMTRFWTEDRTQPGKQEWASQLENPRLSKYARAFNPFIKFVNVLSTIALSDFANW